MLGENRGKGNQLFLIFIPPRKMIGKLLFHQDTDAFGTPQNQLDIYKNVNVYE